MNFWLSRGNNKKKSLVILLIRLFADWEFSWWKYIFFVNQNS